MNTCVCIQAGNTDNKLTQQRWSSFCATLFNLADEFGDIHFTGGPSTTSHVQNYCIVVEVPKSNVDYFLTELADVRSTYDQESVAVITGEAKFV